MAKESKDAELACSYCGKRQPDVTVVSGPSIRICSECVARCVEIAPDRAQEPPGVLVALPNRESIFSALLSSIKSRRRDEHVCSFCAASGPDLVQPPSPLGLQAPICGQCLMFCQDIFAEAH